jgi:hypothetical protein
MFVADLAATKFFWYYSISWFDMLMHFSGGLWVGLFFSLVFFAPRHLFSLGFERTWLRLVGRCPLGIF